MPDGFASFRRHIGMAADITGIYDASDCSMAADAKPSRQTLASIAGSHDHFSRLAAMSMKKHKYHYYGSGGVSRQTCLLYCRRRIRFVSTMPISDGAEEPSQ